MVNRILNITNGTAMIVSDLHGDRDAFDRILARFRTLYAEGRAQRLILLGDLIHAYGSPQDDDSLSMVLDLIKLQQELGPDTVIMLLGNHELPHIYSMLLSKGNLDFTPRFEHAMGKHRGRVLNFFDSLPFYIRTAAGVLLSHAGPAFDSISHIDTLRRFDHQAILADADVALAQSDQFASWYNHCEASYDSAYDKMAWEYLAVNGPRDPRYLHLLRATMISHQSREFSILWDALFTKNEAGLTPAAYTNGCEMFLRAFSTPSYWSMMSPAGLLGLPCTSRDAPCPQRVIVSGHIQVPDGGYTPVNEFHLRLASATHASPRASGVYLLLDCAKPVDSAEALIPHLKRVFE